VPAEKIRCIAREFSEADSAVAIFGSGVTARKNGEQDGRRILLLNLVTGNIDRKGGFRLVSEASWRQPDPQIHGQESSILPGTLFWDLKRAKREPGILITLDANPAASDPDCQGTIDILQDRSRIPYHVALGSVWNETAWLADLVLPAATYLGRWGLHQGVRASDGSTWIGLQQPVLQPHGAERNPEEVMLQAARRVGGRGKEAFPFQNMGQYYRAVLRQSLPGADGFESTFNVLNKKGFCFVPGDGGVGSRRVGPCLTTGEGGAGPQPAVRDLPSAEPVPGTEQSGSKESVVKDRKGCEKTLLLYASPMQGADTPPCVWVKEIEHVRPLWMHPQAAGEIGCAEGDWVLIKGPAGEIKTRVRLTEGIRPEAVAMRSAGTEKKDVERFSESLPARDARAQARPWWEKQAFGENIRKVIPWPSDPSRESPGWEDTRVVIRKWAGS